MLGLVLCIPLLGVWGASSLAAYNDGSRAVSLAIGALVFPIVPLVWEAMGEVRRRRRGVTAPRILTFSDRMTLRTLVLSVLFLAPMLLAWPAPLFMALTTRGDWFLDGQDAAWAPPARRAVLGTADGLVWLYDLAHENPWRDGGGDDATRTHARDGAVVTDESIDRGGTSVEPSPLPPLDPNPLPRMGPMPAPVPDAPAPPPTPRDPHAWPFADTLHPLAHAPADAEVSIAALGAYYQQAVESPWDRAKAVHDWIADHIAYDAPSYVAGRIPPQTAEATFRTRLSVCAGYARLFTALGTAAGLHVETVVGDARHGPGEARSHAWNAIELDGTWYLVDATWDAGSVDGTTFTRRYSSGHFLAPPEVMGVTHFPDEDRWQLRDVPLTRGEWNRQPVLRPAFFAEGLRLISPDRALIEGGPVIDARVTSSGGRFLIATVEPAGGGERTDCDVTGNDEYAVRCVLPGRGSWTVRLYSNHVRHGSYHGVASFDVAYR